MLTAEQQERLVRVGPGTEMGALLRRYWMPVMASCDLGEGEVRKARLLGEDLAIFRDHEGVPGAVHEHCPHRGASLAYGCVDGGGIRCPYHGWKFSRFGECLELPAEPPGSKLKRNAGTVAYPARELGGLIFLYLGPEPVPEIPRFDLFVWDNVLRDIGQALIPCNWLQIMENSVDPYHVEWLHGHQLTATRRREGLSEPVHYPKKQVKIGFDEFEYGIIKRRMLEGGSEEDDDWKIGHPLVFPNMVRVGAGSQHRFQIRVPVDDTQTMHFWYSCYVPRQPESLPLQESIPSYWVPWQDENGDFIVDYIDGQDIMTWVTQGAVADRTREILAGSDRGIAVLRKLLFRQLDRVKHGQDPMGIVRNADENAVINLPQENNKFGQGQSFLREALEMSHVRYSPIRDLIMKSI